MEKDKNGQTETVAAETQPQIEAGADGRTIGNGKSVTEVAAPLIGIAKESLNKIEQMLMRAPGFISMIKATVPRAAFRTMIRKGQQKQIASGALRIVEKEDGSLTADLINAKTGKTVSSIPLKGVKISPALSQAVANYTSQVQMAQIAEQIRQMQLAMEETQLGLEYDRLATAYSCQQKMLQALEMKNPQLRENALLRIVADAEDSRNLLMLSQTVNVEFIKRQPETLIGKFISGAPVEIINSKMIAIRESLYALNLTSLVEAVAYQELGEADAARKSLLYYSDFIERVYLATPGLVRRLDLIDPSPKNYWTQTLPVIKERINALPCISDGRQTEGEITDGRESL